MKCKKYKMSIKGFNLCRYYILPVKVDKSKTENTLKSSADFSLFWSLVQVHKSLSISMHSEAFKRHLKTHSINLLCLFHRHRIKIGVAQNWNPYDAPTPTSYPIPVIMDRSFVFDIDIYKAGRKLLFFPRKRWGCNFSKLPFIL